VVDKQAFPNLYVLLVGGPGSGKSVAISPTKQLWRKTKGLHIAPHSMTSASMLDAFRDARRACVSEAGKPLPPYHAISAAASEFIVFCPAYDLEFLGRLTDIYDCDDDIRIRRKYIESGEEQIISNPCMNLLAGIQPDIMKSLFPEEAWGGGFTSRLLMIYCGEQVNVPSLFGVHASKDELELALLAHLKLLADPKLQGKFFFETEAALRLGEWHSLGGPPKPMHPKLQHYNTRRTTMHIIKLSMIASASRAPGELIVRDEDVTRALSWLISAEEKMPDIFRAMVGRSDGEVLRELHYFLWQLHVRRKKPIPRSILVKFLEDRVPQEKILRLIDIAQMGKRIKSSGITSSGEPCFEPLPLASVALDE